MYLVIAEGMFIMSISFTLQNVMLRMYAIDKNVNALVCENKYQKQDSVLFRQRHKTWQH